MVKRRSQRKIPTFLGIASSPSFLRSRGVIFGLVLVLIWIGVFTGREWARRSEIENEIGRIEGEIARIESSSKELEETLKAFTQSETIEREARRRLNLARPGETVVIIPDLNEEEGLVLEEAFSVDTVSVIAQSGTGPVANMVAWWTFFFGEAL